MPAQSGSLRGAPTTGRYTYRAKVPVRPPAEAKEERTKLTHALEAHRQLLSHALSAIRTMTAARNEMIAQALEDGLNLATISALTGENIRAVRTIGLAYDDLHPSGLPRSAHVDALRAKSEQLKAAEKHRDRIVNQREALIVTALRTQACDDLELASLTGLTPEHIRRSTRGIARSA
ncbi:hypothetical protein ACSBOX_00745 [Arthrobacter sp. KN11-1C]|uniref:hypothetical protein n=1 Tax=Arthrobacter sp. KN11-1C TaxID=3445774 RepID=UPI003FA11183